MKTHILLSFVLILLQNESYGEEVEPGPEDDKIVGGYKTNIKEFPHQVLLNMKKGQERHVCGGSILSEKYILTAAHCVFGFSNITVRAGMTNKDESEKVSPKIPLKSFNCHPKYDKNNLDYDACVIELEKPLTLNGKTTKAVTLADSGADIPAGTNVTVAGWGFTSDDGPLSNTLHATWLQIISSDKCIFKVTPRNICALRPEKGHNACNGDSGGALVNSATHEQLGIVSYGRYDYCTTYPTVYTNIANKEIRQFINDHTGI
ncbi:trypsin 5G1-like isoform X4 [Leptidea sinapis]|uniref:trypsin 5G1-like isoform X4 n=1 Tax=Leptidea sinapis TaxID=189913 RepID=UPI0021C42C77|nr:trypsin 5G1-like isoform X4 [Leptidea sinapis]